MKDGEPENNERPVRNSSRTPKDCLKEGAAVLEDVDQALDLRRVLAVAALDAMGERGKGTGEIAVENGISL